MEMAMDPMKILMAVAAVAVSTIAWFWSSSSKKKQTYPSGVQSIPHLFSWLPYIGSAPLLQKGHIRDFITSTATRLQSPAFTATIMGNKILYIADSALISFIFRDSKQLDSLTFQKRFMAKVLGYSAAEVDAQYDPTNPGYAMIMKLFHTHLLSEDKLQTFIQQSQEILFNDIQQLLCSSSTTSCTTTSTCTINNTHTEEPKELFRFTSAAIFRASAGPLLSMTFLDKHQEIMTTFRKLEKVVGLMFSGAPKLMVAEGAQALEDLVELLDSPETRASESEFLQDRRRAIAKGFAGILDVDKTTARNNIGILLASVANSTQSVFWTIYHLLEDREAYEACTKAAQRVAGQREEKGRHYFTLEELDQLPELQSAFSESLRMYQALFVTREAVQDFVLNPKETNGPKYMVEKGTFIQVYPNAMHMDPTVFENPHQFQYDRFLDPNAKSRDGTTLRSSHLKPFGGGKHMCPGRKFIGYEGRAFLAMLLLQYDMKLAPGETRPGIDYTRQGLATCAADRDVKIIIRKREIMDN